MRARSSLNLLAIDQSLPSQLLKVLVVEIIGHGYVFLVPAIVPGLVTTEQQDRGAPWVEGIKHPVRISPMLDPQLAHMTVPGGFDSRRIRELQVRPLLLEQSDVHVDRLLLVYIQLVPPCPELVGVLDRPRHQRLYLAWNIPSR